MYAIRSYYANFVAKWMADGSMRAQPSPSNYSVTRYSTQYNYMSTQNYVTYDKTFANAHKVTAVITSYSIHYTKLYEGLQRDWGSRSTSGIGGETTM